MKKKRHTPEQIIKKLRAVEVITGQGKTVAQACKVEAITEQTYYRWKKQYAGMDVPTLKQLKHLEQENSQLKKMVAEQALDLVRERLQVSERRACRTLGQCRSTQRYEAQRPDRDRPLIKRLRELSAKYPRQGYRMTTAMLRNEGWKVNHKRVRRLWRQEGLKVPRKTCKKRRVAAGDNSSQRRQAERPNEIWSYDFIHDQTEDGRPLKWLPVMDEHTRENLALEVDRRMTGTDVIGVLDRLVATHGPPDYIRSDNGPEFASRAVKDWIAKRGFETIFIEPGSPWQNAFIESYNSRLRDEFLNVELFSSLTEARVLGEERRTYYNQLRPHSSLGGQSPAKKASDGSVPVGATPLPSPNHEPQEPKQKLS